MEIINWIYDHFDTFAGIFALIAHILVLVVWMMHNLIKKLKNGGKRYE